MLDDMRRKQHAQEVRGFYFIQEFGDAAGKLFACKLKSHQDGKQISL